jgi:hypothetical protein
MNAESPSRIADLNSWQKSEVKSNEYYMTLKKEFKNNKIS